ncbi:MAG: hypothetical protein JWM80_3905 [Cyanobacteria bacterium RYN_339]|nr:hypothetical protein [Cyanobacteria bacterium RYN_339]
MGRILCIDDYPFYADMVAEMLRKRGGHLVKSDVVPLDLAEIKAFDPDVIIVSLVRRLESISAGGMRDFYHEVEGAKAFQFIAAKAVQDVPVIITGLAVSEMDVPRGLRYEAFIEVPQKLDALLRTIDKLIAARRKNAEIVPE